MNLDEYESIVIHLTALYVNGNTITKEHLTIEYIFTVFELNIL